MSDGLMAGTGRSQRRVSYVHGQIIAGEACTKGMPGWCHGGCPVAVRPPSPPARSLSPQLRPARSWDLISRTGTLRAGDECSRDSRGARHGRSVVGHGMAHPRIRTGKRATCSWPASTICVCARAISPADDRPWIDVLLVRFWRSGSAGTRPAALPYAFDSCWLRTGGGGRGRGPRGVRRLCAARGAACTGSGVVQPTRSVSMTRTTMKPVRVRGTLDPQLPPHRWLRCY
jgi:hypothetical protein